VEEELLEWMKENPVLYVKCICKHHQERRHVSAVSRELPPLSSTAVSEEEDSGDSDVAEEGVPTSTSRPTSALDDSAIRLRLHLFWHSITQYKEYTFRNIMHTVMPSLMAHQPGKEEKEANTPALTQ